MDRRDFLKTLGLGGLALTLPKPLSVFAAKVSDLEGPPVHVGLCRFRNLAPTFSLHGFRLMLGGDPGLQPVRENLVKDWTVHLINRKDQRSYAPLLMAPVAAYLGGVSSFLDYSINFMPDDILEVWIVPRGNPRFCLPEMKAELYGPPKGDWHPAFGHCLVPSKILSSPIRSVLIERTRAIELGFSTPSASFEAL